MINSGDTAWVLASTALVMLMTAPGLAFFYGGLVRRKNVLSVMMQSFFMLCMVSVQWVLIGYSLAFGPDFHHIVGGLQWIGLHGVWMTPDADYAGTIPHLLFCMFQMMFAVITPALITGAFAERMKFATFAIFSILWATLVYDPIAHWVWGSGRLAAEPRRARLCRRHRGAYFVGGIGARLRPHARTGVKNYPRILRYLRTT